jgi:uncharacterized protein
MRTVVFRPTNNCNLRCTYCYDKNNHNEKVDRIRKNANDKFENEFDNLIKDFKILFKDERYPKIIFHGGEPLLIYPNNLKLFCNELNKNINNIDYSIQTNGTLINSETIDLFKKEKFHVGVSLDGCNENENKCRIFINGKNSFKPVMKNIKLLKDNNVKFGVIMSINKDHIGNEEKLYDFISDENISCNIRPVFASNPDSISKVMNEEEYATFFNNLFDIWFDDKEGKVSTHQVTELYDALKEVIKDNYESNLCSNSDNCFRNFISLDVDSNLYACNRLYGKEKFYYGNLKEISMEEVKEKIDNLLEERRKSISSSCSNCNSFNNCHGGCPAESYDIYEDILHKSNMCKVKSLVREHIKERVYE